MSIIRDEYSEEVGDMWDAFSKALRTSGRDWIEVKTPAKLSAGGLIGAYAPPWGSMARYQYLAAQQNLAAMYRPASPQNYQQNGLFGGLFGSFL